MHSRVGGRDERHVMSHCGARESRAALGAVKAGSLKELLHFLLTEELLGHLQGLSPNIRLHNIFHLVLLLHCYM